MKSLVRMKITIEIFVQIIDIFISIEKVLQLSNISTKLVLALGATYRVGKPQLIKKAHTSIQRKMCALDEEEAGQDLSH